jgi:hypothetical protein
MKNPHNGVQHAKSRARRMAEYLRRECRRIDNKRLLIKPKQTRTVDQYTVNLLDEAKNALENYAVRLDMIVSSDSGIPDSG